MHVADHRIGRDHTLAVETHDETQRPVRRRVLRTEVEDHVAGVELDVHLRLGELAQHLRIDVHLGQLARGREVGAGRHDASTARCGVLAFGIFTRHRLDVDEPGPRLHLAREQRVVLAQRVALELERQIEVTQRGMTVERDAEHLPGLALVPVGAGIHRHPRLRARVVLVDVGLEDDALMRAERRRDHREHLEAAPPHRRRRRSFPSVAREWTCRPSLRRRAPGAGIQSIADTNER